MTVTITVRTSKEIKEELQLLADKETRSLSYIADRILMNHFKKTPIFILKT